MNKSEADVFDLTSLRSEDKGDAVTFTANWILGACVDDRTGREKFHFKILLSIFIHSKLIKQIVTIEII